MLNDLQLGFGAQRLSPQATDGDLVFTGKGFSRHIGAGGVGQTVADQGAAPRRLPLLEGGDGSNRLLDLHGQSRLSLPAQLDNEITNLV